MKNLVQIIHAIGNEYGFRLKEGTNESEIAGLLMGFDHPLAGQALPAFDQLTELIITKKRGQVSVQAFPAMKKEKIAEILMRFPEWIDCTLEDDGLTFTLRFGREVACIADTSSDYFQVYPLKQPTDGIYQGKLMNLISRFPLSSPADLTQLSEMLASQRVGSR